MPIVQYRQANKFDISAMAEIRAEEKGTQEYWSNRILGYMDGTIHPQQALASRIIYLALQIDTNTVIGFIAGHLTRRYECDGELQWINVASGLRRHGVAYELLVLLAGWFVEQKVFRICVNVDPSNIAAQNFYKKYGAESLDKYWLIWEDVQVVLKR